MPVQGLLRYCAVSLIYDPMTGLCLMGCGASSESFYWPYLVPMTDNLAN